MLVGKYLRKGYLKNKDAQKKLILWSCLAATEDSLR